MRPPWVRYAENKAKVCGGKYEDYVEEYERNSRRLGDIIDEKCLLLPKEKQMPFSNYKTFKDLGMLVDVPDEFYAQGISDPANFYESFLRASENNKKSYAELLKMDEQKFQDFVKSVENLLGEEYLRLNAEKVKYLSMGDEPDDMI